jgi:rifampicin phosphotransferase
MTRGAHVVSLADARDAREVGGKAATLAHLIEVGQPVPDGFVVTDEARRASEIDHVLQPSAFSVQRCLGADLDVWYGRVIANLGAHLGADLSIVRSSAVGEDSQEASFAGQLDSVRDVAGASALRQAIADVWASQSSARVLTYQRARGVSLKGMGVIVQRQIVSSVSGVLFTVAPDGSDTMLVEYCAGSGERLVAGHQNPARLTIARDQERWTVDTSASNSDDVHLTDLQISALRRHGLEIERTLGSPQDIEWTIDVEGRLWIVQSRPITATRAQRPFDGAQGRPELVEGRTASCQQRTVVWSNANVNENFPAPISPLLYSIACTGYYHYFRNLGLAFGFSSARIAAMEQPLRHIIGVHGARMYYNLTSIHGVLRSAPFGEHLAAWFNQFVGSEDTSTRGVSPVRLEGVRLKPDATTSHVVSGFSRTFMQAMEIARIAIATTRQYLRLTKHIERFEKTASLFAERTRPDCLETKSRQELLDDFRGFLDIRTNRWLDASLADAASMVCYGALQRCLARAFPAADQAALHNSLLKSLPDLPSGVPALKLWDLSRQARSNRKLLDALGTLAPAEALVVIRRDPAFAAFNLELDRFLEDWGFRCSGELMLTVPNFQDEPQRVLDILKAYIGMEDESPYELLKRQRAERLRDTDRVAATLRRRRLLRFVPLLNQWLAISILLRWTQRSIAMRERARLKQALLYSRLRHIALNLGDRLVDDGRLEAREDLFFLTAPEIDELITGSAMFPNHVAALVALRRKAHADVSAEAPPDSLALAEGDYWTPSPHRESRTANSEPRAALRGLGVCGGRAAARAAVLSDISEAHLLRAGDVLVTRQTDPGWGAVFPLISGLIMERGGMLSHGAIIAREFGIPSVVGVADATRLIPHGSRVIVDGDRGLVRQETAA